LHKRLCWCIAVLALCAVAAQAGSAVVLPAKYRGTPVQFGLADLNKFAAKIPAGVKVSVACAGDKLSGAAKSAAKVLPAKAESFAIARTGNEVAIVGRDTTGAMYGCLELAERLDMKGAKALAMPKPIVQSPAVEFRAVNPFITLPYKENDSNWWFLQDSYWKGYLDQLARARINWVDLHGMYDIKTTGFPNIYPYFITSEKFPGVGVEPAVAKRNLAMLNKVLKMAKARGIKFALMSYSANWNGQGLRKPPYDANEENLMVYTREVVRKMIEACPDLQMIGFRIGESGKKETFYQGSYIPAIGEAGRPIDMYTRTWGARKPAILEIGKQFPGRFFIEIKYNGEQFGPPYIVAGGRMKGWRDYSYQEYYSYPNNYKIIYQLRANGTHRVFPWGNPEMAARANVGSLLGGAVGLCIEPIDAYYPKYDFRHAGHSQNRWYAWQYQRDWFFYQVWGRTGYDPTLGKRDDIWVNMFAKRFGKAGSDLYNAMKWASKVIPDAYTSYSFGPDHRNHAPELEWGDNVKAFSKGQPFDKQNIISPQEYAASLANVRPDPRASWFGMASYLAEEAVKTRQYLAQARGKIAKPTAEYKDLTTELTALSLLGDYYSHKFRAGNLYAVMQAYMDPALESRIRPELAAAKQAWDALARIGDTHYKPFVDTLRMRTEDFTWTKEAEKFAADTAVLEAEAAAIRESPKMGTAPRVRTYDLPGPKIASCFESIQTAPDKSTKTLAVRVAVTNGPTSPAKVFLKTKAFPSDAEDWIETPMTREGDVYVGRAAIQPEGLMWCVTALGPDGGGAMWPDFRKETPYRCVLPWDAGK